MVIHQKTVRRYFGFSGDCYGGRRIRRLQDPATPAPEQRFHAVENCQIIVDAQNGDARELYAIDLARHALVLLHGNRRGERRLNREMGPAADRGNDADLIVEDARDTLYDRKTKPQASGHLGTLIEAVKFLENGTFLR